MMDRQPDETYGATTDELENIFGTCKFLPHEEQHKGEIWEQKIDVIIPRGMGENSNQKSALLRVFEKLKCNEKNVGNIKYIFYHGDNDILFTLGSFVTTKKHILFFPGSKGLQISSIHLDNASISEQMSLDHISLERDLHKYHITCIGKTKGSRDLPSQKTVKIDDDVLFLWLVQGIASEKILEKTPKKTTIALKNTRLKGLKRMCDEIMKSREKTVFNVISLDHHPKVGHFLNFEIFISSKNLGEELNIDKFYTATGCSNYNGIHDIGKSRIHHLRLQNFDADIYIRLTKIRGTLNKDCVLVIKPSILTALDKD